MAGDAIPSGVVEGQHALARLRRAPTGESTFCKVYAPLASHFSIRRIIASSTKVSLLWALRSWSWLTAGYVATIRSSAPPPTGAPLPDGGSVRKGRCLRLKREESGKGRNWRYADSNQGHHDFQPRCPGIGSLSICRINAKNLAASDGNATATLSRPCIHAAPAHYLAPRASLSTPPYLVGPRARSGPDPGYHRGA